MPTGVPAPVQITITEACLRAWPLPMPDAAGDKEARGRIFILGGSREMPGAVILAATAALRAGAGKLAIATGRSVAQLVALALPEARVIGLDENDDGGFYPNAVDLVVPLIRHSDAVLIGPGMQDETMTAILMAAIRDALRAAPPDTLPRLLLDACAMSIAHQERFADNVDVEILSATEAPAGATPLLSGCFAQVLLTPHAGELAHLTGLSKESIQQAPQDRAREAATRFGAAVALKGATTCIALPDRRLWEHTGGNIGLAISGSGDVLAGIIAGLMARGASAEQAAAWGVALHARAGEQLARRVGPLGYLAREIADEVPALMARFGGQL